MKKESYHSKIGSGKDGSGEAETQEDTLVEERALSNRPAFSIRVRIILAFLTAFLFSLGIAVASMFFISRMNTIQGFFDKAGETVFEIQEARRYEKNFFLYGAKSDLYDASSHINAASDMITSNKKEMLSILSKEDFDTLTANLNKYQELLHNLELDNAATSGNVNFDPAKEDRVRLYGHQVLSHSTELIERERAKLGSTARICMTSSIFLLVINLKPDVEVFAVNGTVNVKTRAPMSQVGQLSDDIKQLCNCINDIKELKVDIRPKTSMGI